MKTDFRDFVDGAPVFELNQYRDGSDDGGAQPVSSTDIRAVPIGELLRGERATYLVKGVLPAKGVASIYGPSASGKTFLTLDVSLSIARGIPWFGRRVTKAGVVYVAAEGETGICDRLRAALGDDYQGVALEVVPCTVDLLHGVADLDALISAIRAAEQRVGPVGLVVIDTLARCMPGGDENTSDAMGAFLRNVDHLRRAIDGLALVVHHSGKHESSGARGHSSFFSAMDACLAVSRDGDRRSFKVAKSREGIDGEEQAFKLVPVELGEDADGDPITSCVVETDETAVDDAPVQPKGETQVLVFEAIKRRLLVSPHFGKGHSPATRPCVLLEDALQAASEALPCEPKRRKTLARRAITAMMARRIYVMNGDWMWVK
jgi:AAA domain